MLPEGHQDQQREPEHRAVERAGGRRDGCVQVEDTRERDARRTEQRREAWPSREPAERAEFAAQVTGQLSGTDYVRAGTPTKRRPSSSYWPGSGIDGASSIGSVPDWVLGNAMTSRMFV